MNQFEIPVVLMIFKRKDKIKLIMDVISRQKPKKVYILADGARNDEEWNSVNLCREEVEKSITWPCEVIKRYAESNVGVYENIAGGAKWVFEREESAIFLEDDNLPDETFLPFCAELLEKYKTEEKVLWICGTNYLEKYEPADHSDYVFTRHMLPCGWASWSDKFLKYYDGDLKMADDSKIIDSLPSKYENKKLYKQQLELVLSEKKRRDRGERFNSWDYQMEFSIRAHDLLGISPKYNQIKNIGIDADSIHGSNENNIMTMRFCDIPTHSLSFPLQHPTSVEVDLNYEKEVEAIILQPYSMRVRKYIAFAIRDLFKIPDGMSTKNGILKFLKVKKD